MTDLAHPAQVRAVNITTSSGPWYSDPVSDRVNVRRVGDDLIVATVRDKANARLIAASPELAGVLREIVNAEAKRGLLDSAKGLWLRKAQNLVAKLEVSL